MGPRNFVLLYVNGNRREISGKDVCASLLSYLRNSERLTGSKLGCGEGGCGACTVMISNYDQCTKRIQHRAINACLTPVAFCDGAAITTIEAVGDRSGRLHPIQLALVKSHGTQCGFCTPGIIMSMFALLREHSSDNGRDAATLSPSDVESNFDGNLCRCTGYRPILDGFKQYVCESSKGTGCKLGEQCCRMNGSPERIQGEESTDEASTTSSSAEASTSSNTDSELLFPPELIDYTPPELDVGDNVWMRPVNLERLIELRHQHRDAHIIVGNTELGIDVKFKGLNVSKFLCATHVPELSQIVKREEGVRIGASVTWSMLDAYVSKQLAAFRPSQEKDNSYKFSSLKAIQSQLKRFAGKQVRNVAGIAGNIVTASPISDMNPVWVAANATFVLLDCKTGMERSVLARNFFLGYRKVDMRQGELLLFVDVPWNESATDLTHAFKVSRRKEDDIAIVSAGIRLHLVRNQELDYGFRSSADAQFDSEYRVKAAFVSLGGVAPKTVVIHEVESFLNGKAFSEDTLRKALPVMAQCTKLGQDVPGGMPKYRQSLAVAFLFKAFIRSAGALSALSSDRPCDGLSSLTMKDETAKHLSAVQISSVHISGGRQILPDEKPKDNYEHVSRSIEHLSARLQVSGEAKYLDDVGPLARELQAALVLSTEAHARILSVDYSVAESMPGVVRILRLQDVRGNNSIGVAGDEFCFADSEVTTMGQVIAIVTAETLEQAKNASQAVKVSYAVLDAIITIEEAIDASSFAPHEPEHIIKKGDARGVIDAAEASGLTVKGCVRIGAQEHWYLESHGTIAVPDENGEMTVLASTQTPSKTQATVASVLGEPMHKIVCKVKRLGGGFGGKETRSFFVSAAVAVAAQTTSRPVRLILDRDTDMLTTGTRHAFLAKYEAAFEETGRITALDLRVYLNMGNSFDLSIPVLDRCLYHAQNCYDISNVAFVGKACKTNSASSTAFRGFGGPQGMMIAENVIEHVAHALDLCPASVREINMYGNDGNSTVTSFGMHVHVDPLRDCWTGALQDSEYDKRREVIKEFNHRNHFKKRGISAIPTMFGISFTFRTYNQAAALVHIYHQDGTVLISHGGVEMGQGLHTKMCQIAATELRIPMGKVFISETGTDKVPNASPTAASASSDMYGMAVKKACEELLQNLEPFRKEDGNQNWEELVHQAWFNRVSLSATGFYRTPHLDEVDLRVPGSEGRPFFYYTYGAAVTEVEIDTLTGESEILRTDIVMDVGRPLNPAIDVGQIEGAFVQGLGWCTMEEVVRGSKTTHTWLKPGKTHTLGPSTYKIPGFRDIPLDFRVRVLDGRCEETTIHSSKGIGEPPLFLAASAFFAIRDAIKHSRSQYGVDDWFALDSPASVERIRLSCLNKIIDEPIPSKQDISALSL